MCVLSGEDLFNLCPSREDLFRSILNDDVTTLHIDCIKTLFDMVVSLCHLVLLVFDYKLTNEIDHAIVVLS